MNRIELTRPGIQASTQVIKDNPLLELLSPEAAFLIHSQSHQQDLPEGALAWDVGDEISDIFFPISGMLSIGVPTPDGHAIEVGTIGRQGAAGLYDQAGRS